MIDARLPLLVVTCLLLAAATIAQTPATAPTTTSAPASGSISGKLVDEGGKPLAGAEVSAFVVGADRQIKTLARTRSGQDGTFKLTEVPPRNDLRVWASLQIPGGPSIMGEARDQTVQAGKDTNVGVITLRPARM